MAGLAADDLPVVVVNPRQERVFAKATWKLVKTNALQESGSGGASPKPFDGHCALF